eukprot:scaffold4534_cov85-Amphora_coffeaeformis.AAC.7
MPSAFGFGAASPTGGRLGRGRVPMPSASGPGSFGTVSPTGGGQQGRASMPSAGGSESHVQKRHAQNADQGRHKRAKDTN